MTTWLTHCVADGAVVYAPDHYGHGCSAGERALVEDVEVYVDDLHAVAFAGGDGTPGSPVVLIGHSLGGVIATRYAQRYMSELAALVLSAPVIGGNPAFEPLLAMDPMPEVPLDPAALSRDPAVGEAYAADPLVYHGPLLRGTLEGIFAAVQTIAAGPRVDSADAVDPWRARSTRAVRRHPRGGRSAAQRLSAGEDVPGRMHEIFNETNREEVIADTIAFIDAHV